MIGKHESLRKRGVLGEPCFADIRMSLAKNIEDGYLAIDFLGLIGMSAKAPSTPSRMAT
jgi:hypothetical protein